MKRLSVFFLAVIIGFAAGCGREAVDEHAEVSFMIGEVLINSVSAEIGTLINQEDTITTSSGAFCDVKIGDSIIRIRENSKVVFATLFKSDTAEDTMLHLDHGRMLSKPKRLLRNESFKVSTPTAVAAVRGTQFIVEADTAQTTRVRVYEGTVNVVKRVKQLEGNYDKVLEQAPDVSGSEMVVVSKEDVERAERAVEEALQKETAAGTEDVIGNVINLTSESVVVGSDRIAVFDVSEFLDESEELIAIEEKPEEVKEKIVREVKRDKKIPKPEGRIVITRHEIYYIKDGLIAWQGPLASEPLRENNRIYAASKDYIFCAEADGPVLWRIELENDGKLELEDERLSVESKGEKAALDPDTGRRL